MTAKTLAIIDGYGFLFRAYHSLPPLHTPSGVAVGAVYGFCNMLIKLLNDFNPDYVVVALDTGKTNFRHEMYSLYKANRSAPAEDLVVQFPIFKEALDAFSIHSIGKDGYEADDVIASLVKQYSNLNIRVISSDKDLLQLMKYPHVTFYDPVKNTHVTEEYVKERYGVEINQLLDFFSIIGDTSDNIPGIKGMGVKTAAKLLAEFPTLDSIYSNLDHLSARQREMLENGRKEVELSKNLIRLDEDIPLNNGIEDFALRDFKGEKLAEFLSRMGFKSVMKRLNLHHDAKEEAIPEPNSKQITLSEINQYLSQLAKEEKIAFLLEKDGLGIASENLHLFISHASQDEIISGLQEIMVEDGIKKLFIDAKWWYKKLQNIGQELKNFEDINLMSYCINAGKFKHEDLLVFEAYNLKPSASNLLKLHNILFQELLHAKALEVYLSIERPLIKVLANMELKGILIDVEQLKILNKEFNENINKLEKKIYQLAGAEFNIGSPKQLGEILFDKLKLPSGKKQAKSEGFSTSSEVLEKLSQEEGSEIAALILEWRRFNKLVNTYIEVLPKMLNPNTNRIYTTFSMSNTTTGRLSSKEPNLQNIPIRTEAGYRVRSVFIAKKGYTLLSADYSQVELRLLAHIANVDNMKAALTSGEDIHATTASEMFGVSIENVTPDLRRKAKMINYGIIYGISFYGLARRLGIKNEEAKSYIEAYFAKYPGIKLYMTKTIEFARANGYVSTLFGRRCHIREINNSNYNLRAFAERAAINAPLQGTAADIIKKAMINLPEEIRQYLVLQVHDELLFEIPIEKQEIYCKEVDQVMQNAASLSVPLSVECSTGPNWYEAH